MKIRRLSGLLLACLPLLLGSCQNFLEEEPKSLIATTAYYRTNNDAIAAINGAYAAMRADVTGNITPIWVAEAATDDAKAGGTPVGERLEVENLVFSSQHSFVRTIWNTAYNVINRSNNVIAYVDSSSVTPSLARRIHAEARFLRAFYYARLVQLYGDVPLLVAPSEPTTIYPARTPKDEVFKQIIADLQYAETNLAPTYAYTDTQNGGRATIPAAKSLLGYVYMVMAGNPTNDASKWQLAATKLGEVIASKATYNVDLVPVYRDIFDVTKKATNKENIFYYRGTSGISATMLAYTRLQYWYYGFTSVVPTNAVIDSLYEAGDSRRAINLARKSGTIIAPISTTTGAPIVNKYIDNIANSNDNQNDFHAIRYSDVLLMYAESLLEVGGVANLTSALTIINQIRTAHGGATLPLITFSSQNDLRQKLRLERRRELLFEGKRWYDLVRWNVYVPVMKAHMTAEYKAPVANYEYVNQNRALLPLPYIDVINNPNLRPQNPGY